MKAMIFAAGLGTRLKPLTNSIPKALVEVNGKPLLQHNIERLINFGVTQIVVNVHHFANKVQQFLVAKNNFGIDITISDETDQLLDTGGGLAKAKPLLDNTDSVIIQNADVYTNINYTEMLERHSKSKALATLAVRNRSTSRYLLFNSQGVLSGWKNVKTDEKIITRNDYQQQLAFSGIHIVSAEFLSLLNKKGSFSIIDVYLELSKTKLILGYEHSNDDWFDVGTVEKLAELNKFLNFKSC